MKTGDIIPLPNPGHNVDETFFDVLAERAGIDQTQPCRESELIDLTGMNGREMAQAAIGTFAGAVGSIAIKSYVEFYGRPPQRLDVFLRNELPAQANAGFIARNDTRTQLILGDFWHRDSFSPATVGTAAAVSSMFGTEFAYGTAREDVKEINLADPDYEDDEGVTSYFDNQIRQSLDTFVTDPNQIVVFTQEHLHRRISPEEAAARFATMQPYTNRLFLRAMAY